MLGLVALGTLGLLALLAVQTAGTLLALLVWERMRAREWARFLEQQGRALDELADAAHGAGVSPSPASAAPPAAASARSAAGGVDTTSGEVAA